MLLTTKPIKATDPLFDFVESFWMLDHASDDSREVVILPDGRIDLFFSKSATEPFHVTLLGLGSQAEEALIAPQTRTFAISFKLPATEYILHGSVAALLNEAYRLPDDFWGFNEGDLYNFDLFCTKATHKIKDLLPLDIDGRKRKLFELIYASNGSITVKELSEQVYWSSRQINRYFNGQYGIPLKSYCSILRFKASFRHISEGKLFPDHNFSDQSHFIREVKRLSGVLPKDLKRNQNDRFIQFSSLPRK